MVVRLGWYDAHKVRLLQQELIAVYRPLPGGEGWLELQTRFTPAVDGLAAGEDELRLPRPAGRGQPRSAHYGGGRSRNSGGDRARRPVRQARRVGGLQRPGRRRRVGGRHLFDHPGNPARRSWHVRDDGWMSPAFYLRGGVQPGKGRRWCCATACTPTPRTSTPRPPQRGTRRSPRRPRGKWRRRSRPWRDPAQKVVEVVNPRLVEGHMATRPGSPGPRRRSPRTPSRWTPSPARTAGDPP